MSDRRKDVATLMTDLAHLSGLAHDVIGEEVDWFAAELDSIVGEPQTVSEEGPKAKLAAQRETVRGELETLAKRFTGVLDFVEAGKVDQAAVSLEKILEDGARILERLPKAKAPPKKTAPVTQAPGQGQPGQATGGEPVQSAPSQGAAPQPQAQGEAVYMDGYLITEEERRDPFGFGLGLVESVRGLLGMKGKRK